MPMEVRRKDRLYRKLRRLAPEAKKELAKAAEKAGDEMVATARRFAPSRTGRLRNSIRWQKTPEGNGVQVTAGDDQAFYARMVEFGTAPHEQPKRGTFHPGTPAQPYFFPAYRVLKKRAKSRFTRAINKSVKQVAGR